MNVEAVVERKRKTRTGRGFSREELKQVGLSFKQALKLRIPIDVRRRSSHKRNVEILKMYLKGDSEKA